MREQYLAAVRAHLARIGEAQDVTLALAPEVQDDLGRLTAAAGDDLDVEAGFALGWLHWYRYLALPEGLDREELGAAIRAFFGCFIHGVEPLPGQLLPILADAAVPVATAALEEAMAAPGLEPLQAAVGLWRRIVTDLPRDDPAWPGYASNLGVGLHVLFEHSGDPADLDAAVEMLRDAVTMTPSGAAELPEQQYRLGRALLDRFKCSGARRDLEEAIDVARLAADADPGQAGHQWLLGTALRARFEATGVMGDLDEAIEADRRAVADTSPGQRDHAGFLGNLGSALNLRFERAGDGADLDAAIAAYEESGEDYNFGVLCTVRFLRAGVVADLDAAISAYERALGLAGPAARPWALGNLGAALRLRFEHSGDLADLDAAVRAGQAALDQTPEDDPGRGTPQTNLGIALLARFRQTGRRENLDAAVSLSRQALAATPPGRPEHAAVLNNLALALARRFEADGTPDDIEDAVRLGRESIEATPASAAERPARLANLALALRLRFEHGRSMADLDAAVDLGREAITAIPDGHPDQAILRSDLGTVLHVRYRRTGAPGDLDAAVQAFQDAADATAPGRPVRAGALSDLGVALRDRFARTGAPQDLDAAIAAGRQAVEATPPGAPALAGLLSILGEAYLDRFEHTGTPADLDAAIAAARQAVAMTQPGSPDRAVHLAHLGNALKGRADLADEALAAYQAAVADTAGGSDIRIAAARAGATLVKNTRPEVAAQLLETAVGLLPAAIPRRLDWGDREHELSQFALLAGEAAALALAVPGPSELRALRLLESGRAVLLSQMTDTPAGPAPAPSLAELRSAAEPGPIVVFNVSRYGSDALLLTTAGITRLPLPALEATTLIERFQTFLQALPDAADTELGWRARTQAQDDIGATLEWLWDAAAGPVLDALGLAGPPAPGASWPRIWWIPGGMLSLLPLHAAGHHREARDRTVMDRVISSYAPTVRALRRSRQLPSGTPEAARALVVAMPATPEADPLPYAADEAELLHGRLPDPLVLVEPDREAVLAALADRTIAHFACHGTSDPFDPSQSGLLLADHQTAPLTVADLASAGLARADLAYLSACGTAQMRVATLGTMELDPPAARDALPGLAAAVAALNRTTGLLDEAIHLASAFQAAGFRHVVGTLWEINDAVTLEVTDAFYTSLRTESGVLDTGRTALALHHAVRALRDRFPGTPSLWAAYLHAGA
jgi:tetratricopeptide (TPR) repeat protein